MKHYVRGSLLIILPLLLLVSWYYYFFLDIEYESFHTEDEYFSLSAEAPLKVKKGQRFTVFGELESIHDKPLRVRHETPLVRIYIRDQEGNLIEPLTPLSYWNMQGEVRINKTAKFQSGLTYKISEKGEYQVFISRARIVVQDEDINQPLVINYRLTVK